jgi:hypothetical protein
MANAITTSTATHAHGRRNAFLSFMRSLRVKEQAAARLSGDPPARITAVRSSDGITRLTSAPAGLSRLARRA